jgi:hypothetical protein
MVAPPLEEKPATKLTNNQSLNPNGVAATHYKESRDVGRPLDAPLLGSDMIHMPKDKIRYRNTWTDSRNSTCFVNFDRLIF